MDNSMIAVVSTIMIGLGFLNGMMVTTLLDKYQLSEMHTRTEKVEQENNRLQRKISFLEDELEDERAEKEELLQKLNSVVRQFSRLPPPDGPLHRSQACSEANSSDEFTCPTSPFPNPGSME
jgi:hypothetical protein